jgi:GMP synthase-like glutamine amidotransferase
MRAALIANAGDADSGLVGKALRRRGYGFVEFIREQHQQWGSLEGLDLVVSMGSGWSTYWEHVADPIHAEQRLLSAVIAQGTPVLGICFGAQQLSTVLGGQVTKAQSPEIGWHHITPVAESALVVPPSLCEGPWMQWHYDRFSVPSGATVLAESPAGPQAMVCGRTLGVQFHPEATESIVRTWSSGDGQEELQAAKVSSDSLQSTTSENLEDAARRCDELIEWFLSDIAQRHIDIGLIS